MQRGCLSGVTLDASDPRADGIDTITNGLRSGLCIDDDLRSTMNFRYRYRYGYYSKSIQKSTMITIDILLSVRGSWLRH